MKKVKSLLCSLLGTFAIAICASSQEKNPSLENLLPDYYGIKNALVTGNAAGAAKEAGKFPSLVKTTDIKVLSANEQTVFRTLQATLLGDANSMAATNDLAKQRAAFQTLSANVITVIKATRVSRPAYIAYCPMKKAYWISADQGIANPYYGSSMLSCGKVTETLK